MKSTLQLTLAAAAALIHVACSTSAPRRASEPAVIEENAAVAALTSRLVGGAELRADPSSMRVSILRISEGRPAVGAQREFADSASYGPSLEHEFTEALAARLHLIDGETDAREERAADLEELARRRGATHALVGSYLRRPEDLLVSVRLVDVDSRLIVATARGSVPIAGLKGPVVLTPDVAAAVAAPTLAPAGPQGAPLAAEEAAPPPARSKQVTETEVDAQAPAAEEPRPVAERLALPSRTPQPGADGVPAEPADPAALAAGDPAAAPMNGDAETGAAEGDELTLLPAEEERLPPVDGPAARRIRTHGVRGAQQQP